MNNSITTKTKLPSYYNDIEPSKGKKPEPHAVLMSEELCVDKENLDETEEWLNVLKNLFGHIEERASFPGFYSRHSSTKGFISINQLLPILPESINTPTTVRHFSNIIVKLTEKLNLDQVPIITADQPVCALGRQVQWLYPHEFLQYYLQITLAAWVKLVHQVYLKTDYSCYDDWKKSVMESSNTFLFTGFV